MTGTIFVLNGPNLNLLGHARTRNLRQRNARRHCRRLTDRASELGVELDIRQSNHEGHLIDWLHEAGASGAKAVILNPGGYTHTSVAIRDAVAAIDVPVIEVHLSNPDARESFRRRSLIAAVAKGSIKGFGAQSYMLALDAAARL